MFEVMLVNNEDHSWRFIPASFGSNRNYGSVTLGSYIYLFGGYTGTATEDSVKRFNGYTFEDLAPLPFAGDFINAVAVGTDIYLLGGGPGGSGDRVYMHKYNTLTNTYTRMKDLPYNFYNAAATAVGTDIYFTSNSVTQFTKYDTLTTLFTVRAYPYPKRVWAGESCTYNGKVYVYGGYMTGGGHDNVIREFTPSTNTWKVITPKAGPKPQALRFWGCGTLYLNRYWIIAGGVDINSSPWIAPLESWAYDFVDNKWLVLPELNRTGFSGGVVALGKTVYRFSLNSPIDEIASNDMRTERIVPDLK